MKRIFYTSLVFGLLMMLSMSLRAQIAINTDGSAPDPSAVIDMKASDKGFALPRMTHAQRLSLAIDANSGSIHESLAVYQTNDAAGAPRGIYIVGANGVWRQVSARQEHRATVLPSAVIAEGQLPGATITNIATGVDRIDFVPAIGANAVVLVNPEANAVGSPPVAPGDYCVNSFSGNCNTAHHTVGVLVSQPAGGMASYVSGSTLNFLFAHCPVAASCSGTSGNYNNHVPGVADACYAAFGQAVAYNGNFSGSLFGLTYSGVNINAISAGSAFDLTLYGNYAFSAPGPTTALSSFIDWNQDGDFYDVIGGQPENIMTTPLRQWIYPGFGAPNPNANASGSTGFVWPITVPANAVSGNTTLRVISTPFANNTNPCIVHNNGSTRDYQFAITGGAPFSGIPATSVCSVSNQDASGFEVRCYSSRNASANDVRYHLLVNPQ